MRKLLLILGISVSASNLLANVGVFSGFGYNLSLSKSEDIQMQSEVVKITPMVPESPVDMSMSERVWAEYDCEFVLKNLSDKKVEIQVGFPLANGDYVKYPSRATQERNFKVTSHSLDNKEQKNYKFDYTSKDKEQDFSALFYWDMTFMPNETKIVNVTYNLAGYYGLGMTMKNKELNNDLRLNTGGILCSGLWQMFGYVTKTGNSWAGEIESAKFIFDLKNFEEKMDKGEVFDLEIPENKTSRKDILVQMINKGQWTRFLNTEFEEDKDGCFSANFAPFTPMDDFELIYFIGAFPKDLEGLEYFFSLLEEAYQSDTTTDGFNAARKKDLAGIILAYYGIEVDNPSINAFVELQRYHKAKFYPKIDNALKEKLLEFSNNKAKSDLTIQIENFFENENIPSSSYAGFLHLDKEKNPRFIFSKIDKDPQSTEIETEYNTLKLSTKMLNEKHCEVEIYADVKPNYIKEYFKMPYFKGEISLDSEGLETIIQGQRLVKSKKGKNAKTESLPCAIFIYNKK